MQNSNQPPNWKRLTKKLEIRELPQLITLYVMTLSTVQNYTNQKMQSPSTCQGLIHMDVV